MTYDQLRKAVRRTPFKPVRIVLDSGESMVVRHPEGIIFNEFILVVVDGSDVLYSEPAHVSCVRSVRNGARRNGH